MKQKQIDLSTGPVIGFYDETDDTFGWKGVPYAEPPVGAYRWRKPVPPRPWTTPLLCSAFRGPSMQKSADGILGSEDCLYVNVFVPALSVAEKKLPVLFMIHGGNNQNGSTAELRASFLADQLHSVVVTVQFRLNYLGWLFLPALEQNERVYGNYGLFDIEQALLWVKENIEAFGGDPENIVACGYSSGGRSLLCMLASKAFQGLFHKLIVFSSGYTSSEPEMGMQEAVSAMAPLFVRNGRYHSETEAKAFLSSSDQTVRLALERMECGLLTEITKPARTRMRVFPHLFHGGGWVIPDGEHVFQQVAGARRAVPILAFCGAGEFSLLLREEPYLCQENKILENRASVYDFANRYGSALFAWFNTSSWIERWLHTDPFAPVFVGKNCWGTNPAVTDDDTAKIVGGTHGLDFYIMMGIERDLYAVNKKVYSKENLPGRNELGSGYRSYIKQFLRNGDPNGDGMPTWTAYTTAQKCVMQFDADQVESRYAVKEERQTEAEILRAMMKDSSVSEKEKEYLVHNILSGRFFTKGIQVDG